jgi:phytoene dehydrogenase-like protein
MTPAGHDVIVVGAGLNGLTAAAYLSRAGLRVLVLEANGAVGGTTVTEELAPGFRVDTVLDDVGFVPGALVRELGLHDRGLELLRPDPAAWLPLDGGGLALWRDPVRAAAEIRRHSAADAVRWPDFVARMAAFADVLGRLCALPAPQPLATPALREVLPLLQVARRLRGLGRDAMTDFLRTVPLPIEELLADWFASAPLAALLAADGVRGLFQGVRSGGTAFAFLHHRIGAEPGDFGPRGIPRGGAGRLAELLAGAAREAGAEVRCGVRVARVLVADGRCRGVVLGDGTELRARCVASSADPRSTFLELLGPLHLEPDFVRAVENIRVHGVWSKVNLALGGPPAFRGAGTGVIGAGRILLADDPLAMERAYDAAKYGRVSDPPLLEARVPTLADPTLAPDGRHVLSVRVQYTPRMLRTGVWDGAARDTLLARVLDRLDDFVPGIRSLVIAAQVLTPADLEARCGATHGDTSDGQLALDQILFMRPVAGWSRYATPVPGLFLCGSGAHPGPGLAGAAGRLAAAAVLRSLRDARAATA